MPNARPVMMLLALAGLSGCAHTFVPGPGMTAMDLQQARGRCGLVSRQHDSGFSAQGRPGFVAAVALTSAIGDAVRTGADFDDCMLANGAIMDDGRRAAAPPVMQASAAAPPVREVAMAADAPPGPVPVAVPAAVPVYARPVPYPLPTPVSYQTVAGQRSMEAARSWLQAQKILDRGDRKSRDLYLVLCGAGDQTACVMAATMRPL